MKIAVQFESRVKEPFILAHPTVITSHYRGSYVGYRLERLHNLQKESSRDQDQSEKTEISKDPLMTFSIELNTNYSRLKCESVPSTEEAK